MIMKTDRLLIIIIFLLYAGTCLILSCSTNDVTKPSEQEFYIYGYVFFDSTETTEGILVRLIQSGDSTYTDASGEFRFYNQQPDTYTVVANDDGYDPSFAVVYYSGNRMCKAPDLELSPMHCTPKDSLPDGYPLGVRFCADISFTVPASLYNIGDSLFIAAWEYYLPPLVNFREGSLADVGDVQVISSLGDKEITHIDRVLGSIPEVWRFGYIIDSAASSMPILNNGVIEVETTGGWIIVKYESYWMKVFVCNSIVVVP